jgi:segregation and condensation protein A
VPAGVAPIDAVTQPAIQPDESFGIPRTATCAVKLPSFEGPLDLLLHLCRANEVDITDLPIALLSEQYLQYLELMRQLDIDVAAEYLLVAATLAHIKSRLLLPSAGGDDEDEGADPRAELMRRLAEYARFQEVARTLSERPRLGRDVFTAGLSPALDVPEREAQLAVSLFALVEAMGRVLARVPAEDRHHHVLLERFTLSDRMLFVMDSLRAAGEGSLLFEDLLADGVLSRERVVVTFLALLELARIQALLLFQSIGPAGQPDGPVRVRLAVQGAPDADAIARAAARAESEMAIRTSADEAPTLPPTEEPNRDSAEDAGEEP